MGSAKGTALVGLQFLLRTLQFCCAALVLAVYAYFLALLGSNSLPIGVFVRAVLGIAGAATAYTMVAFLFLCCAPGHPFPSFLMMALDVAFVPCFGFLFAISCVVNLALARHRKRERRFGPSPANDYTAGYGKKNRFSALFGRRRGAQHPAGLGPDPNALPVHTTPAEVRNSYGTDNTRVASNQGYGGLAAQKYEQPLHSPGVGNGHANGDMGLMNGNGNGYANGNGVANGTPYGNGNGYGNLPPPQPAARYWNSNTHTGGYRG
ncbi:hypothetical protein QBC41DRAFT_388309 [Cercophora samala]|uniref:MARVEL domain-containing protein n=1 Tax=Cercophora samala TaxID=330535 RepID=A0AA39ZMV7_9PEZI|nr:hypothetical protein QBC41DRAFT_388309 [Cercophora samala]